MRDPIDQRDEPHPAHDARQMMAAPDQDAEFQIRHHTILLDGLDILDVGAEFGDRPGVVVLGSNAHI